MSDLIKELTKIHLPFAKWIFNLLLAVALYQFHVFTEKMDKMLNVQNEIVKTVSEHDGKLLMIERVLFKE